MTDEPEKNDPNPPETAWLRHLDGMAEELSRLAIACDLKLREPGVVDRILRNDESVCGTKNPIGFRKLRALVMATYDSLGKSIDRIGATETKLIADAIVERLERMRNASRPAR